jgi:uncharacterized protein YfiM (DUF2279 family)
MSLGFSQDTLNYDSLKNQTNKLTKGILLGSTIYSGSIVYFTYSAYQSEDPVAFHYFNDWQSFLQVDKFQHAFGSYVASSVGYNWLLGVGLKKKKALFYGVGLGIALPATKELIDAFNQFSGFSWTDLAADFVGSAIYISQEALLNQQFFKYKISYSRSSYAEQAYGYLGNNIVDSFFKDHNGHTYWLSVNINKILCKNFLPDWFSLAAGYSANGMFGAFKNINSFNSVYIPETERYRQFLLSLDIDWSKIKTNSKILHSLLKAMNFIKMPFPALEFNNRGQIKGYWVYF